MKKNSTAKILLLLTSSFILIAFIFGKNRINTIQTYLDEHASIIKISLWQFNLDSNKQYLQEVAKQNGYSNLTISDNNNNVLHKYNTPTANFFIDLLIHLKLIPILSYKSDIYYHNQKLGTITALWRCDLIYFYFFAFLFFLLIFIIIRQFLELESRVHERTSKLQNSEKRFRTLIEQAVDSIFILDPAGNIHTANKQACTNLQYSSSELKEINKKEIAFFTATKFEEILSQLQERKSVIVQGTHRRKDNSTFPVEISFRMINQDDKQVILAVARDLSELERINQAYYEIYNATNDPIFLHDAKTGEILDTNYAASKLYGYTRHEILNKTVEELSGDTEHYSQQKAMDFIHKTQTEGNQRFEWCAKNKKGEKFWLEVALTTSTIEGQGRILAVCRDITRSKELEDELRQSQKMEAIGTLAGGIAHDFNNILGAIIGYGELIRKQATQNQSVHKYITEILKGANRASDLIKRILTFSRQTDTNMTSIKASDVVTEALDLLRASLPKTIGINVSINSDAFILADPVQLHQIIINLCTNAKHAMPEGGTIDVSLNETETHLKLAVADTGTGMPQHVQSKIFDPYFSTKPTSEGTGMGLSIVHGIIQSFGGTISVTSKEGAGTSFEITFPKVEQSYNEINTSKQPQLTVENKTIIFVDDEESLAEVGKEMLESIGYNVLTFTDSREALECFRSNPALYDLIISDLTLPHMSGNTLVAEILNIRPDIPTILCSGFHEEVNENNFQKTGAIAFLQKPISLKTLSETVQKALQNSD